VELNFENFIGQQALKAEFRSRILLASPDGGTIPHVLLCGPLEMGKVTFAHAVANEMGAAVWMSDSPILTRLDLIGVLSNTRTNDVVVIPELDLLKNNLVDTVVDAISSRHLSISLGTGSGARTVVMDIVPFTLVATTSKPWQIAPALRRWFVVMDFKPYSDDEMSELLSRLGTQKSIRLSGDAAAILARHCRGTPGNALALLRRIEQHYSSLVSGAVTSDVAWRLLDLLGYGRAEDLNVTLADRLRLMSSAEFEQFVAGIFGRFGWSTELTATSGDHGIDILMRKGSQAGAVQCKRWTESVGEPVVREFLGSIMGAKVEVGFIATTSSFTEKAQTFARTHGIRLLDLDSLIRTASTGDQIHSL
jgi:Holliday junction resolvasome RuvABC ATP-dependent DNA helicase subunit